MAEDETFNKGDTGGEVLIERAGKFELLNANDMRADNGVDKGQKGDESSTVKEEDVTDQTAYQVTGQKSAETVIEDLEVERKTDEQPTKVENESKSEAAISTPVKAAKTSNGLIKRRDKGVERLRTKSAPSARANENQEAFEAWLAKKNEEITAQRREERAKQNHPTPEEIRRKKEDNEASFQAWLDKKKKQIVEERAKKRKELLRPTTGHSRQECGEAFKAWLDNKKLHELEERRYREARLRQQQEEANKVKPDLAKQAYRE